MSKYFSVHTKILLATVPYLYLISTYYTAFNDTETEVR